jgi:hypothetical protein
MIFDCAPQTRTLKKAESAQIGPRTMNVRGKTGREDSSTPILRYPFIVRTKSHFLANCAENKGEIDKEGS